MMNRYPNLFAPTTALTHCDRQHYVFMVLLLAVGTFVRFWGLGNVGLFDDEETMAMPAMAILETGLPYMPSGALYLRALPHTYLIAASAWLFGESEWAFRLPSAIVGSLTGLAAFFMGRRFLPPAYNLAFVATITLLPGMIEMSQTARMYVFLLTGLIVFTTCIFRWERDRRPFSLLLALLFWAVALTFHQLAIFASLLFLLPGVSNRSWRQLAEGLTALVVAILLFYLYRPYTAMIYPMGRVRPPPLERLERQSGLDVVVQGPDWLLLAGGAAVAALLALGLLWTLRNRDWRQVGPLLLLCSGLLSMAFLQYYVGVLLLLLGAVFWVRADTLPRAWLVGAMAFAGALTATQVVTLYLSGFSNARKLIGAMVGQPSVWPALRLLVYSPFAAAVYGAVLLVALVHFARGRPLPVHFLFFGMAVLAPLFALGYFEWFVPPRYASGQLPAFLLCTFAGLAYLLEDVAPQRGVVLRGKSTVALLVVVSVALVNPVTLARTVNPSYETHPDHKGAAEYIKSRQLDSDAVLIAEDVLQQTYYLGRVDYWLRQIDDSHRFGMIRDGRLVDNYTATSMLGTGDELKVILRESTGRDVFVIGSGENFVGDIRLFRGRGIQQVLDSDLFEVVYEGRDQKTKVWKLNH